MTEQIEIVQGIIWTVAEPDPAPPPPPAPAFRAQTSPPPANAHRRPWRYSLPARLLAFGSLAVWITVSAIALVAGGQLPWPWHIIGPALMAAMIATIDPHAGGEHSAYFAPCTPSRANTITGRK